MMQLTLGQIRWAGDSPKWLVLAGLVAALALAWWLYRRESKHVAAPYSWLLPALRCTAIALALITLLGPVFEQRRVEGELGKVTLLLDSSASMRIDDQAADQQSRYQRAINQLSIRDFDLLRQLTERHQVKIVQLDSDQSSLLWESTADTPVPTEKQIESWQSPTWKNRTLLGDGILRELNGNAALTSSTSSSVVVLLSDGGNNAGVSPLTASKQLKENGQRLFSVGYGPTQEPSDLALIGIKYPERIFREDTMTGSIEIKDRLANRGKFRAEIRYGEKVLWESSFESENADRRTLSFSMKVNDVVEQIARNAPRGVAYSSVPLPLEVRLVTSEADVEPTNNSQTFWVHAVTQKNRLLIVDGRSRWETRYIKNVFERDEAWSVNLVTTDENPAKPTLPHGDRPATFPSERSELMEYDLIMLGDVPAEVFTPQEIDWLVEFVQRNGGGLIVTDGQRQFLKDSRYKKIHELLPVEWLNPSQSVRTETTSGDAANTSATSKDPTAMMARAVPTLAAEGTGIFDLDTRGASENRALWNKLPEVRVTQPMKLLPGGETLLEGVVKGNKLPLIATRQFGAGKVLFHSTDETWRWRLKVADLYHQKFWNQLARWVMKKPFSIQNDYVAIDTGRVQYNLNDVVPIRARLRNSDGTPAIGSSVQAEIKQGDKLLGTLTMTPDSSVDGVYLASIGQLPAGEYAVGIVATGFSQDALDIASSFRIAPEEHQELRELACNSDLLESISQNAEGAYLHESSIDQLPQLLQPFSGGRIVQSDTILWQSYGWFLPIVGLLAIEWWLRKRSGLI